MGVLHRRIEIVTHATGPDSSEGRSVVEDDYHHFRVTVRQEAGRVTEVFSEALRNPTTLCGAAGARLTEIVGMPLNLASSAVMEVTDARQQCTHQIDLAGLTVAALAAERPRRVYEASVPDRVDDRTRPSLRRDGEVVLEWEMEGSKITAPSRYAGRDVGSGFTGFARGALPLEEAEAALVLRRAVFISGGRNGDDHPLHTTGPIGGCWVWQPEQAAVRQRVRGSTLDFTHRAEELTRDDQDWLRFVQ